VSALTRVFFRTPATMPERAADVIDWWESRRPIYNLGVGAAGVLTLGVMNVMFALPPNPEPMPWQFTIVGPLLFGTAANVCYSAGWMAELFLRHWIRHDTGAAGAALFRYGFAFSIGLTLVPAGIAVLVWLGRVTTSVL
jgi:hypothetical protein